MVAVENVSWTADAYIYYYYTNIIFFVLFSVNIYNICVGIKNILYIPEKNDLSDEWRLLV